MSAREVAWLSRRARHQRQTRSHLLTYIQSVVASSADIDHLYRRVKLDDRIAFDTPFGGVCSDVAVCLEAAMEWKRHVSTTTQPQECGQDADDARSHLPTRDRVDSRACAIMQLQA
jgi:hypothetical protein